MLLLLFKFLSFLFRSSLLAFTLFVVLLSLYSRVEDYMFLFPSPSLCSPSLPLPCFPLPPGSPSLDESSGFYAPHDLTNEILYRSFLNDKKTFILVCPLSLSLSLSLARFVLREVLLARLIRAPFHRAGNTLAQYRVGRACPFSRQYPHLADFEENLCAENRKKNPILNDLSSRRIISRAKDFLSIHSRGIEIHRG